MDFWLKETSLKPYNTFGVEVSASSLALVREEGQFLRLLEHVRSSGRQLLILGGGSNVLLVRDWAGVVALNKIEGIHVVDEDSESVVVKVGSGHNWHRLVMWSVERGLGGIENLALIPGSVGAGPMQNIGAYGVELSETFVELEALSLKDGTKRIFGLADCGFGYRHSVFKAQEKGKWFIRSITLRLSKRPELRLDYGNLREEVQRLGVDRPGPAEVAQAVINIRRSKLPDPAVLGNAGSFFKNPEVPTQRAQELLSEYPSMPTFASQKPGFTKLAAGWLIEQCGLKGYRRGPCGVHERQALVLVNYGGATGRQILDLALHVQETVHRKFDIMLEPEVNIIA
ncbi:MAG: UDP-N-acetylmuramate dehydrogenase [Flavobacteriales bacterium]|nr:UDP-N-acetylmuramate dehydrogenase [Flavobacteriales bacterium]